MRIRNAAAGKFPQNFLMVNVPTILQILTRINGKYLSLGEEEGAEGDAFGPFRLESPDKLDEWMNKWMKKSKWRNKIFIF